MGRTRLFSLVLACFLLLSCVLPDALARHRRTGTHKRSSKHHAQRSSKKRKVARSSHRSRRGAVASKPKSKPRYAYAADFFMWNAPEFMENKVSAATALIMRDAFMRGGAQKYAPNQMLSAGVFLDDPMSGGIFRRREDVKYIILHSTETGRPADASRVIKSWSKGLRHPGAQYVVDRDGSIHQTVDPQFGTVHVNIFKTQYGVNNDNSVGIEIVRAGSQKYTSTQLASVTRLVAYLQGRFGVTDDRIYSHHDVQPSDRTDPVNFDWVAFRTAKANLRSQTLAFKRRTQSQIIPKSSHKPQQPKHMLVGETKPLVQKRNL